MKTSITFCLILLCSFAIYSSKAQSNEKKPNGFLLRGTLIGQDTGMIYLISYSDVNKREKDSCRLNKGHFLFKGFVNGFSDLYYLKLNPEMLLNNDSVNAVNISLENAAISITLVKNHFSKFKMMGSPAYEELKKYESTLKFYRNKISDCYKRIDKTQNINQRNFYNNKIGFYAEKIKKTGFSYINKNTDSKISPYILYWMNNSIGLNEYKRYIAVFNSFTRSQKNSFYGIKINQVNQIFEKILNQNGQKAPDFSGLDFENNLINLHSVNSKNYVLLDFWASWCVPCRAGNPHLRNLYKMYHSKGFEVIALSDDNNSENWRSAIISDSTTDWINLLLDSISIKGAKKITNNADVFLVETLPTIILLNKNGEVVGRFDSSNEDELDEKLKRCFDK